MHNLVIIGICPAPGAKSSSLFLFLLSSCTVSTHVVDDPDPAIDPDAIIDPYPAIDPDPVDDLAAWSSFHAQYLEVFTERVTYSRFTSEKSSLLSWPTWSIT